MADKLKDPVCGADVESTSHYHETAAGKDFAFCSAECRSRFAVNPGRYLQKT